MNKLPQRPNKSNEIDESFFTKPRSVVDQVYRSILRAISAGSMKSGQLLIESELQKSFGVSRGTIREAIRLLEAEDIVVVDNFKKKYVRKITIQDFREVIPVLACLEGLAARLATDRLTEEEINRLRKINKEMMEAYGLMDYGLCISLNIDFHKIYIDAVNNKALKRAIRSLIKGAMLALMSQVYWTKTDLIPLSASEHEKIIEAFQGRDKISAEMAVNNHVSGILAKYLKHYNFNSDEE